MSYTPEVVAELEILCLFNLDNSLEGLKVHHDAGHTAIAAAERRMARQAAWQPACNSSARLPLALGQASKDRLVWQVDDRFS